MNEKEIIPQLTLDPAAEAAAQLTLEPEAAPRAPQLSLDTEFAAAQAVMSEAEAAAKEAEEARKAAEAAAEARRLRELNAIKMDESILTEEERKVVDDFSKKIDIKNASQVLQYGAAAQKNIAAFSENALNSVKTKDLGEIGEDLTELVNELKGFDATEEKKGLFGFFKKQTDALETLKTKYTSAEKNVDKIVEALEAHQITLMKDVAMLDQMYALNEKYYKELTMYIIAGKKRVADVKANELEEIRKKAEET
ncbi:MAG: toxic anion resistance protein, partial [Oscillospiraceae bacterium]|nr:toxic anion resistance protein [Oscillospiraceae bacterium]